MDKAKALNECEPQATHEFSALPVRRTQRAGAYATASLVRPDLCWEDRVNQSDNTVSLLTVSYLTAFMRMPMSIERAVLVRWATQRSKSFDKEIKQKGE